MPIINLIKKFFKKFLAALFLSFILYQWAKGYFPENWLAKAYIEKYENFLSFSSEVLANNIPGLENYLSDSQKDKQKKAFDNLANWEWDILDRMGWAFEAMDKYVMVQKWILVMQNPDLAKEFSTTWVWDIQKSIKAMQDYKKMQEDVFEDAWIWNDQSYMTFQEIMQYWNLIDQINKWEKTQKDLLIFLENLPSKSKEFDEMKSDLRNDLLKIWEGKIKEDWWVLEDSFDKTMNEKFSNGL